MNSYKFKKEVKIMGDREEVLERKSQELEKGKSQELEKVTKRLSKFAKYTGATFEVIRGETDIENSDGGCILCPPKT